MPRWRKAPATVKVVVAASALLGITQVPAAIADTKGTEASAKSDCVSREKFREDAYITRRVDRNLPGTSSGDIAYATDPLFDPNGRRIGITDSKATMFLRGDPTKGATGVDLMQYFEATDYFWDGSVYLNGTASVTAVLSGQPSQLAATGESGVYQGKIGIRTFRLIAVKSDHIVYESSLKLCTPPPFPAVPGAPGAEK